MFELKDKGILLVSDLLHVPVISFNLYFSFLFSYFFNILYFGGVFNN